MKHDRKAIPDGLDGLRLGRGSHSASVRTMRWMAGLSLVWGAVAIIDSTTRTRVDQRWSSSFVLAIGLLQVSMAAMYLANGRCEADVHAGRRAAWAYAWDWLHVAAAVGAAVALLRAGTELGLAFGAPFGGLMSLVLVGRGLARRRRARALARTDVDSTFD